MALSMRTFAVLALAALIVSPGILAEQAPPQPSAKEREAGQLLQASDWAAAVPAYRDLVAAEAGNPRAWFGYGVALHEVAKYADALTAFRKAQELKYGAVNQLLVRMARTHAKLGDAASAISSVETLAANGFQSLVPLQHADFDSLRSDARFVEARTRIDRTARPCEFDSNFRKFDFWIGEWDVQQTGLPRAPVGASSKVERLLEGCVLLENWTPPAGPAGKSFNIYNTATSKWEQYWVDAAGRITHYIGEFRADGNLYFEAEQGGPANKVRMTFFSQGPDQVRQLGHISSDGGKSWTVTFDLTYIRKK